MGRCFYDTAFTPDGDGTNDVFTLAGGPNERGTCTRHEAEVELRDGRVRQLKGEVLLLR